MGTGEELEKLFLHWLCRLEGLGPVTVQRIGAFAGGFRNAYYIEGMELKKAGILKREESWQTRGSVLLPRWTRNIRTGSFICMTIQWGFM